jgi:hypothetical protein
MIGHVDEENFGTSLSATAMRCARLSLAPLIVMRWYEGRRAWCWSSAGYESRTGNRGFRQLEQIPQDSVTRETLSGAVDLPSRGTTLATWFPKIRAGSYEDDLLVEECLSLGPKSTILERISNPELLFDELAVLKILGVQNFAACMQCGRDDN